MSKRFILNADDFGMSVAYNDAVLEGYAKGILKSASICANGEYFDDAVKRVIPNAENLSVGVHLNIIEGKSLTNCPLLTDKDGTFSNGYISMILKSYNKDFLVQVENEFRAQIERAKDNIRIDHIDSHVHTHAIPNIFRITAKLAKEYNIPYIRTQYEKFYIVPYLHKHLNMKYPPNILKIILLNTFTMLNRLVVKEYGLRTNDYLIGVGYTGMMDDITLYGGLKAIQKASVTEALIHPCKYQEIINDSHHYEYLLTQNDKLKSDITNNLGFDITNHSFEEG